MRLTLPAPFSEGLTTWRATESTRRLVLYALLGALVYPLLNVPGTLGLRLTAAGCCLALAAVVLAFPRVRPEAHVFQVFNVGALLVFSLLLFVAEGETALSLGVVLLAIFASQYAFVRRRDLAAVYAFGAVFLIACTTFRGALTPSVIAMIAMIVAGFVVSYLTGAMQITTQLTLVRERMRRDDVAHLDSLTGLQNRAVLFEWIDGALASARRRKHDVALLYVDLNGFKEINDTFGHGAGDEVLSEVGSRLKKALRGDEVAGRVGGDEFVILLPHVVNFNEPQEAAARIIRVLDEPVTFAGRNARLGASIGVARSPYDGFERDALLARADAAMYARKRGLLREA